MGPEKKNKRSLADFIVDHNKAIRNIVLILVAVSALCSFLVNVNYDLTEYLPDTVASKVAINKLEETFGYPGTGRLMINDVTIYEAKRYKDEVEDITGVDQVVWCDTLSQIYVSDDFIDYDDITDYYQDGSAVMDITFSGGDSSQLTYSAIDSVEELVGEKGFVVGPAATNKFSEETIKQEMNMILAIAVVFIFLVLLFMTNSWFEPVLFLAVLGCAVLLNKGTNIIVGTISHITNNICIVLQLATSMDYSIFLLHSYERERAGGLDKDAALRRGLDSAITTIMASSLTTFFGFVVLVFMRFTLGFDLGVVMAKSIICSLFMIIFLMPSLLLSWSDLIDKYRHRPFIPGFSGLARFISRAGPFVLAAGILLAVPIYTAKGLNSFKYGVEATAAGEGTDLYEASDEINLKFGRSNLIVAIFPDCSVPLERELTDCLEDKDYVKSVMGLSKYLPEGVPESILPESVTELFHKDGYARLLIYIATAVESDASFRYTEEIEEIIRSYYPEEVYITGNTPVTRDMREILEPDYASVNRLALISIFIIVALSFRSVLMSVAALVPIELAICTNMAMPYLMGEDMIFISYLVVSSVQLGATIDYAISEISNYLQIRKQGNGREKAAELVTVMSLPSILTSGIILIACGYIIHFVSSVPAISSVGLLVGQGTILSVVCVAMIMPTLLKLIDPFITVPVAGRLRDRAAERWKKRKALKNKAVEEKDGTE